jgi:threonine/homoserine/homoserine lactone efflux protein
MDSDPERKQEFIAAAIVLLAMPFVVLFGMSALGFAALTRGGTRLAFIAAFLVWVIVVIVAIVALIGRLQRTTRR